jgi:4-hydroxy-4-methyl-2-oxoglutarate aldolase
VIHLGPDFERLPQAIVAGLLGLPTATVSDVLGPGHVLAARVKPLRPGLRVAGTALTLRMPPTDNLGMHVAVSMARPGDVIVCDHAGGELGAPVGDIMAVAARVRGVAGIVLDGVVRDIAGLRESGWPVFAIGSHAQQCAKAGPAWIGLPIECAGVAVRPGDAILGDDDGVVVIPRERVAGIGAEVVAKQAAEARRIAAIQAGDTSPAWLPEAMRRAGIRHHD